MEGGSSGSGSRCMRSQVGPEWTVKDSLILVNEIAAVEADCLKALSTYQKWKIISENCTALDVPRTSNQCRRKWDSLLAHYTSIVKSRNNESFDVELFKSIDEVVRARENQSDTEPDSDPEAKSDLCEVIAHLGSKRQRRHFVRAESRSEGKPPQEKHQKTCMEEKHCKTYVEEWPQKGQAERKSQKSLVEQKKTSCLVGKEEILVAKLREDAELVHTLATQNADYSSVTARNFQDCKSEFARRQGDKLIARLEQIVETMNELSDDVLKL